MGIAIGPGRGEEGKIGVGIRPCTTGRPWPCVEMSRVPPPFHPPARTQPPKPEPKAPPRSRRVQGMTAINEKSNHSH